MGPSPDHDGPTGLLRRRDFYAGALLILLGIVPVAAAPSYGIGTLTVMGPGFMPFALGILLILLGIVIAGSATTGPADEGAEERAAEWWGWSCVLAGPILFLLLGAIGGLAPAIFGCVFVSALGDRTTGWKSALVLAFFVTITGIVLFSYLLLIPMPILAWRGW